MSSTLKKFLTFLGVLGVFSALYPWYFGYSGTLAGIHISIRTLGNGLGPVLVIFGLVLLFSPQARSLLGNIFGEMENLASSRQFLLIIYTTFLFLLAVISHKLKAHQSLDTHAQDLGFFSNICWNTAHGNWFYSSCLERNFMGVHVNWILWPLSYFYRWGGDARALLVAQAVFFSAGIPILWKIVQDITGRFTLGAVATLLLVSAPAFSHGLANDFHPDGWQFPMLLASLFFWVRKKNIPTILFGLLALLAKEDASFVLAGYGLFLFMWGGMREAGVILFTSAVALFLFHTQIFIPQFLPNGAKSVLFERYPLLGSSYPEMIHNLVHKPSVYWAALIFNPAKYGRLLRMFIPAMGFSFLAPSLLIPALISIAPHLISQASTQLSLADIYALPLQPFIFVSAAVGFKKMKDWGKIEGKEGFLCAVALVVAGACVALSTRFYHAQPDERIEAFGQVEKLIPKEASLATQQNLYAHFDTRSVIEFFPMGIAMGVLQTSYLSNPDYILADRIGNTLPYDRPVTNSAIKKLESEPRYEKIYDHAGLILFKRTILEVPVWEKS